MDRPSGKDLLSFLLYAGIATAVLAWAATRWPYALSLFGFESPYWDVGLLPILTALALSARRLEAAEGQRRRFLVGFLVFGIFAAVAYTASCLRPARWSLVSMLQPFQTGYMLARGMKTAWGQLSLRGIFVDTAILVLIPLMAAVLGGIVRSVRISVRRMMVLVAIMAVFFAGVAQTIRRARYQDRMGLYHRSRIIGVLLGHTGHDGKTVFEPQPVDRRGKAVSPEQRRLDRWHEAMAQRYWHASYYPWSPAVEELTLPD